MFFKPNSLRVLFVLPALYRSGAVDLIVNLAEELVLMGMNVEILALEHQEPYSRLPNKSVKLNFALGKNQSYRRGLLLNLLIRLIRSAFSSDIIILTWENGPAVKWPSGVAHWLRKPTLAIVQNNIQESLVHYKSKNQDIEHGVLRKAYAQAKAIVCVSKDLIASVEPEVSQDKITSISNGIDIERVCELSKLPCPSTLPSDEIPFVVGLGRLASQKGFDLLIQAHSIVLKRGIVHRLVLIGEGPDESELMKLCQNLAIVDSVIFFGYLENPYPVLAKASLFCLSSRYEGRPLSLMEASVLSIPTIATDCLTGPREILEDGIYGDLVETESVKALSNAIENHFRDPQRLMLKAQASAKLADRFSMQKCARKYSELIKHCV